jgi:hypothetical protein
MSYVPTMMPTMTPTMSPMVMVADGCENCSSNVVMPAWAFILIWTVLSCWVFAMGVRCSWACCECAVLCWDCYEDSKSAEKEPVPNALENV